MATKPSRTRGIVDVIGALIYYPGPIPVANCKTVPRRVPYSHTDDPMSDSLLPLLRLMQTLAERAESRPPGSYTTRLLDGGVPKIGEKILEEANELIEAAGEPGDAGRDHFVYEAADLLYHTMVLLAHRGVDLEEVAGELARREGTSGLVEKANRNNETDEE